MKQKQVKETNIVTHNFILSGVIKTLSFIKKNIKVLSAVLAVVLLIAAALCFICARERKLQENSWRQFFITTVSEGQERAGAAELLRAEYASTTAGLLFKYNEAEALYDNGEYQAASEIFNALISAPNKFIAANAQLSLAAAYSALNKPEDSLNAAQAFLNGNEDGYAAAQAYLLIAMAQEKLGKTDDAKLTYALISERYPGYYNTFAQNRLKVLK